jgi:sRNA-binding carbon storage regulator CsrA
MLLITLREGDYFLIGDNVKVSFERTEGRDVISVGVDAPREVQIQRGQVYERKIAQMAEAGDIQAQQTRQTLMDDYEQRVKKYNARRASREEHDRRIQAGEIRKPDDYGPPDPETHSRRLERMERDRRNLITTR